MVELTKGLAWLVLGGFVAYMAIPAWLFLCARAIARAIFTVLDERTKKNDG